MSAIWVIDDFIDLNYQEQIKNVLMGEEEFNGGFFPWYYVRDITDGYKEDSQGRAGLSHVYVNYEEDSDTIDITSDHHGLFLPLLRHACHTLNIKNAEIIQGRSFLQFPLNLKSKEDDTPHVDLLRTDFFVVLYYVCDADGDTVSIAILPKPQLARELMNALESEAFMLDDFTADLNIFKHI